LIKKLSSIYKYFKPLLLKVNKISSILEEIGYPWRFKLVFNKAGTFDNL
tara:strand:+ start:343 stop:489 length:147 start_codon:yes stop_codon:yes gene_type:complete